MNILMISKDLSGGDLCLRLKKEGHHVKIFIEDRDQRHNMEGMLEKVGDWKKELKWVGDSGLIIFDSTGHGRIQDDLRMEGYSVVGGSYGGDRLEDVRQYGQKIFSTCGLKPIPSVSFHSAKGAIEFLKKNKGPWVLKQNGHADKGMNYVGKLESNIDVIRIIKNYHRNNGKECHTLDLQKKVEGIEFGVGRYFNGSDWVGPLEMNIEHKDLFNGDLGPKTFEMGTLEWFDDNENNKLFQATLAKLKPYLEKVNFKGDIDVNCIVNKNQIYPLEVTARLGFPAMHLQTALSESPWGEFLKAVADGKAYDLKFKKEFGVVVLVATPPFPYEVRSRKYYPQGLDIFFRKEPTAGEMNSIHFEEVSLRKKRKIKQYYISSKTGFILHVTGTGKTVEEAREKAYALIRKIVIPKMFYRTDIGLKFIQEDRKKLKEWGWI
jgi:phosphoribosylamine---glycine ligase